MNLYLFCREPIQHFIQQGVQGLCFGVGEVHATGHRLGDARGFALERFAFGGEAYGKLPKVNSFKKKSHPRCFPGGYSTKSKFYLSCTRSVLPMPRTM